MTYREFILSAVSRLAPLYHVEEARAAASALLCHFLDIKPYTCLSEPDTLIGAREEEIEEALVRMEQGCPLQYVTGYAEFCGMRIRVAPGVLIPRPETEELAAMVMNDCENMELEEEQQFNILDMCTGSGCIAYAMAREFPAAQVFGCDLSDDALAVACRQRVKLSGARPVFFRADILQAPPAGLPKFDIIVSNPPYVRESEKAQMRRNVLDYEPAEALFVPDDDPLRYYRAIRSWCDAMLAPGGRIYLEVNESLANETAALFEGAAVRQDLSGKDRFVVVVR